VDSANFSSTFTILVGPEGREKTFTIHEDMLCSSSKFFQAACSKVCAEAKEKVVRVPEVVQHPIFQSYALWVYSGKIEFDTDRYAIPNQQQAVLIHAWIAGDILDDVKFRNEAMRMLVHNIEAFCILPHARMLRHVWKSTPSNCILRGMLVSAIILHLDRDAFSEQVEGYPRELVETVAI